MKDSVQSNTADKTFKSLRVAVLEDDPELREAILLPGLRDFGFEVTAAGTAAELYRHMVKNAFDMVVLDMGLPDEDGLSVVRHLQELPDLGIVMLTGSHSRNDRVRALREGADAYLAKPADIEVLAATLHSLSRRIRRRVAPEVALEKAADASARWHLDTDGWCLVSPRGQVIALSAPERRLLRTLIAEAGAPVDREALIALVTKDVYNFDPHRLDMMIHRLRRKISKCTNEAVPLLTARGTGYIFVAEMQH